MILVESWALAFTVWLYYILVVSFKKAWKDGKLTHPVVKFHAGIVLVSGFALYILLNITLGTLAFLDPPREWEFTKRCRRYIAGGPQMLKWNWLLRYRSALAEWICKHKLDPFEEGGHC